MLAFVFRAFFLICVISWYSTSVWKMIDVYFKNRFESYLRAEYDKNPHMLADVEAYRAATAGKESPTAPVPEEEERLEKVVEACSTDACLASKDDNFKTREEIPANKEADFNDPIETSKPEASETTDPPRASPDGDRMKKAERSPEVVEVVLKNDSAKRGNAERKKTRRLIARGEEVKGGKTAKKKLRTITLTEKDFASTRIKVSPQDFAEFDLDEDLAEGTRDEPVGLLVSELPFKPKLELGDLRRVSPEEFCPMTLEDELSCDETTTWP